MGLDLWFRDDVVRILAATYETMAATQAANPALDEAKAEAYQQGFEDALQALAVAFGVASPRLGKHESRPAVLDSPSYRLSTGRDNGSWRS